MIASFFDKKYLDDAPSVSDRFCWRIVFGLTALAFGLQLLYFFSREVMNPDEISYLNGGISLARDGIFLPSEVPPLLPLLLAGCSPLGTYYPATTIVLLGAFSALRVIGVYGCAIELWSDRRFALSIAFCAAIHPYLIYLGGCILRDGMYITVVSLSLWTLMLALTRGNWRYYVWFAILAAMGGLLRKEGLELMVIFLTAQGIFLAMAIRNHRFRWHGLLLWVLVPVFVLGILKCVEFNVARHGSTWRLTTKLNTILQERF